MGDGGEITGDKEALSRLVSLANITARWFVAGGIVAALGLGLGGYVFFVQSQTTDVHWSTPWFVLCFLTGITVCLTPAWSLLEGCNQVSNVYTYRFFQGIAASLAMWVAICCGARLWSVPISVATTVLSATVFLRWKYTAFFKKLFFTRPSGPRIDWRKEILPMQWRIALSWISGYLSFSFFTPVIFHFHGPAMAGQFGMTWSVVCVVSMIAGAWLPPKVPRFGILIARGQYNTLDRLFWRTMRLFTGILVMTTVCVWTLVYFLCSLNHPIAGRLLPLLPTTLFLLAQAVMGLSLPFSAYLRAHKKEPLLLLSMIGGGSVGLTTFIMGKYFSATAIGLGYLFINMVMTPFVFVIWQLCRMKWHTDQLVIE
jgi:O-antigen/teichoic acid export membrane protein